MNESLIKGMRGYSEFAKRQPFPFWTLVIGITLALAGWRFGWF